MYLPPLTDDELLRYAGTLQLTPLEHELARRFEAFKVETGDKDAELEKMEQDYEAENQALHEELNELEDDLAAAKDKVEALEAELIESLA